MSDETRKALIAAMEGHWTGSYIEAGPIVDALTAHVRDEMGGARPAEARDMEPARGFREAAYLPAARVESLSKERDTLRALLTAEAARVERAERERDEWKARAEWSAEASRLFRAIPLTPPEKT